MATGSADFTASPPESAVSASLATPSLTTAAPQTTSHYMGTTQHSMASTASVQIAWEGDAGREEAAHLVSGKTPQAAATAVATFISPDISQVNIHLQGCQLECHHQNDICCVRRSLSCSPKFVSWSSSCSKWKHSA